MAKYQFYISYSHRDGMAIAQWAKKELTARGYTVFLDEDVLPGTDWVESLAEAIRECDAFVPIITEGFLASTIAMQETEFVVRLSHERSKYIVPLVCTTQPWPVSLQMILSRYQQILYTPDYADAMWDRIERTVGVEIKSTALYDKLAEYREIRHEVKAAETLCALIDLCCHRWTHEGDRQALSREMGRLLEQLAGFSGGYDEKNKAVSRPMLDAMSAVEKILCEDTFPMTDLFFAAFAVRLWHWIWEIRVEAVDIMTSGDVMSGIIDPFPLADYVQKQADSVVAFQERFAEAELTLDQAYTPDEAAWLRDTTRYVLQTRPKPPAPWEHMPKQEKATEPTVSPDEEILLSVAKFMQEGNKLFDVLQQRGIAGDFLKCLLTSYERLKTYCQIVGATSVAADCVDRIMEIRALLDAPQEQECGNPKAEQGIKSLLGFTLNTDEKYDVFISFKDADADLAEKMYQLSRRHMKKPFWSKRSLPELSKSEYEKAIYQALDRSTHFVVVLSNLDYLNSHWVELETGIFHREIAEGRKPENSNFVFVMTDELYHQVIGDNKRGLPIEFRGYHIIKMSEYQDTLMKYIR